MSPHPFPIAPAFPPHPDETPWTIAMKPLLLPSPPTATPLHPNPLLHGPLPAGDPTPLVGVHPPSPTQHTIARSIPAAYRHEATNKTYSQNIVCIVCISLPLLPVSSPKPQPYQMKYEAGLVVFGPVTQLEAEIWIQNMENHFGSNLISAQCHIYPKVQQVVKQEKDAMKETLKKKILEEPVMIENIEDPDEQGLTRFFSNACYSCGEEGHYSQDCMKGSQEYLGNFPTEKVEFDPLEIVELAKIKESEKKKKYPRKSQISADIDLSHVRCYKCMEFGHHKYMCSGRKSETQGAKANTKKPRDLSELICFYCKEAGHYANDCPHGKKARME
ncbi:hypothetical protein D1007_13792 [Hordeum vulgare]|nr:hypothetical protein D1007_13792 [Hordeum vulgare]